jgi:hypothetical protein
LDNQLDTPEARFAHDFIFDYLCSDVDTVGMSLEENYINMGLIGLDREKLDKIYGLEPDLDFLFKIMEWIRFLDDDIDALFSKENYREEWDRNRVAAKFLIFIWSHKNRGLISHMAVRAIADYFIVRNNFFKAEIQDMSIRLKEDSEQSMMRRVHSKNRVFF